MAYDRRILARLAVPALAALALGGLLLAGILGTAATAGVGVSAAPAAPARSASPARPPAGLTAEGRLRWNFESLLRATFGAAQPAMSAHEDFSCAGPDCTPLAVYEVYEYTFARLGRSSFRLASPAVARDDFGNYPVPVLVRGRGVACDRAGTRFLVTYGDAVGLTLGCLAPLGG